MVSAETTAMRCDQCLYWTPARPSEGWCRRRAPRPGASADRVAHWPTTHGGQGCGEFAPCGEAAACPPSPAVLACGQCRYWRAGPDGLDPVDRADKPLSWWARAGHCLRHAPAPFADPGPRAFWRATHVADSCAEGAAKA